VPGKLLANFVGLRFNFYSIYFVDLLAKKYLYHPLGINQSNFFSLMDKVSVIYFKSVVFTPRWGCIFIKNSLRVSFSQCQRVVNTPIYYLLNTQPSSVFMFFF